MKQPTIHNPSLFNPADYEIVDYIDNQPPKPPFAELAFCSAEFIHHIMKQYEAELKLWEDRMQELFPDGKYHQCAHCGNGRVRYIVCAHHIPSDTNVCIGDVCEARLSFKNRSDFKAAQVRSRAAAGHARMKVFVAMERYIRDNPSVQKALLDIDLEVHSRNEFAKSILGNLKQYGSLSARQLECLLSSLDRDLIAAEKRAAEALETKGPAPTGREEVQGIVLMVKEYCSDYGTCWKMLVKLDNNSKVFCSVPSSAGEVQRGDRISCKATWTSKEQDPSFATGKRPIVSILQQAKQAVAAQPSQAPVEA